ncbi:helix-turn-helix domain-containing protein [Flavobacterium sp. GCM10027622]
MIEKHPLRELLGITQNDLCLLLKVHKSQLAMFEIGKRNLPGQAITKLSSI